MFGKKFNERLVIFEWAGGIKKSTRFVSIILIFSLIMLSLSCEKDKCFYGTGERTSRIINSDSFRIIEVNGLFDIELVQDSAYFVQCQAGSNIIDHVEANIKGDTLNLNNYNACFWLREYKRPLIRIHFSDILHIDVNEAAYFFSVDSLTDNFSIYFRGGMGEANLILNNQSFTIVPYNTTGGKYVLKGRTQQLNLYIPYTSVIDASNLQAGNVVVEQKSVSDARVWALERLEVKILNRGNIYYRGSPEIIIDSLASTGKLIHSN